MKPLLSTSPALVHNNPIAIVSGKANYRLSFDIVPTGIISGWGSILHFTTVNNCCEFGSRSPAIWFWPGTSRMHVRIGDSSDGNWGIDTDALPFNVRTTFTLECKGNDVKLTVGGKVYTATQPTYRFTGKLIVYAGDPWHDAAKAQINRLNYKILPTAAGVNAGKTSIFIIYMVIETVYLRVAHTLQCFQSKRNIQLYITNTPISQCIGSRTFQTL